MSAASLSALKRKYRKDSAPAPAPAPQVETPQAMPEEPKAEAVSATPVHEKLAMALNTFPDKNPLVPYQDMTQNDLMEGIKAEKSKARSMAKKSLEHVRNCGEMLIALKSKVGHGQWKFSIFTLDMSQKTASNYMRIASNWQRVAVLDRGVKDALKLLCREDTPPAPPAPPALPIPPVKVSKGSPFEGSPVQDAEIVEPSDKPLDDSPMTQAERDRLAELEKSIDTGLDKMEADGVVLASILVMLPRLTKQEIQTLSETLKTRWL